MRTPLIRDIFTSSMAIYYTPFIPPPFLLRPSSSSLRGESSPTSICIPQNLVYKMHNSSKHIQQNPKLEIHHYNHLLYICSPFRSSISPPLRQSAKERASFISLENQSLKWVLVPIPPSCTSSTSAKARNFTLFSIKIDRKLEDMFRNNHDSLVT